MMIEKPDFNLLSDDALWKLAKKDNREAFMVVYDRYSPNLYIYIIQIVSTRIRGRQLEDDTKEIIILVFETLWRNRRKLSEDISLEDNLFTLAYKHALDFRGVNGSQSQ
jgi:DNA-directed RNA polymerase specialized sigma24 family protein